MTVQELDARRKIILAGSKLFAEQGFDGTSTRDISKEAGVNLSLISYYFGGKEGLYKSVLFETMSAFKVGIDRIIEEFDTEELTRQSFETAIHAFIDAFFEMRSSNRYVFIIFEREMMAGMPVIKETNQEIFKSISEKMQLFLKRAQKKGIIDPDLKVQYFLGPLVDSIIGYFMSYDCCQHFVEEVSGLKEDRSEFKKQISIIFLKGIFK